MVAPFAGAWIEMINLQFFLTYSHPVAPFAGAWIEIPGFPFQTVLLQMSHPSRVRGLKFFYLFLEVERWYVAPFAGAWIEIYLS